MKNAQLSKGNKLEEAVELIEKTILESNPSLKADNFKIETKKIIMNGRVRYEIDIYVEINQGFDYKSIFIFECKNWGKKVSTDEIIKFAEKIDVVKAQKGFFVAKEYTSSAQARAKQDKRIDLLYLNNNPFDLSPFTEFEFMNKVNRIMGVEVFGFGVIDREKAETHTIDFENCTAKYKEREVKFKDLIIWLIEIMANEKMRDEQLNKLPEGKYSYYAEKEFLFKRNELWVKESSFDKNVEKIKIRVYFDIKLTRPKIVSKIDIITRGRVIEYELVKTSTGGEIKFNLVTINAKV